MAGNALKPLLVVEDNVGIQKQLKWSFEGYEVLLAGNRASALEQVQKQKIPVVTLDLGLPPDPANASEGLAALQMLNILETFDFAALGRDSADFWRRRAGSRGPAASGSRGTATPRGPPC